MSDAHSLYNRGWLLREEYERTRRAWSIPLGMLATDEIGCGILEAIARVPGDHLDIGTGLGAGSAWIVARTKTEGTVYSYDADENRAIVIRENIRKTSIPITFQCASSSPWPGPFETAYIDGDHTYDGVSKDWAFAKDAVRQYVVFDDLVEAYPGIVRAYTEARETPGWHEALLLGRTGVLQRDNPA